MSRRALLAWRKSRTSILTMLLVLAIVAYGAQLYSSYAAGQRLRPHRDVARIAGADAQAFSRARRQRRTRSLLLNATRGKRAAAATWVFSEYATRALRTQLASASPDLVIDGGPVDGAAGPAEVSVHGCYAARIRSSHVGRIIVPLTACPIDRVLVYSVSIRVQHAAWLVRSIALQAPEYRQ
jgi:hypothetical protein